MNDDVLRRAAALMRERANAATAGPWIAAEQTHGEWYGLQSQWTALGTAFEKAEAEHIASWHPAVALAIAEWLLFEAGAIAQKGDLMASSISGAQALTVANAYLGETA